MNKVILSIIGSVGFVAPALAADVIELSQECEVELAYSAGSDYLRDGAGVYVLGDEGFERVVESTNGYYCMVVREGPNAAVPQCFDEAARSTHMRVHMDQGEYLRDGLSYEEIRSLRDARFEEGWYQPVDGHGVVYMMSEFNLVNANGTLLRVAPHVMVHAPNVSYEDIASTAELALTNRGMPFITTQGPMSFIVSFVDHAYGTERAEQACAGQLPDLTSYRPFPPRG